MLRRTVLLATVLASSVAANAGCRSDVEPRTAAAPESVTFPLPDAQLAFTTNECSEALRKIEAGLALADDLWFLVSCAVDALARQGRGDEVQQYLNRVHEFEVTTTFLISVNRTTAEQAGLRPPAGAGDDILIYATRSARLGNQALAHLVDQTLGAGSYRGLCLPWQRKPGIGGHYEVTKRAVAKLRVGGVSVTAKAEAVMADASQDPDSFAWTDMGAHGQTADANGLPGQDVATAEATWRQWVARWFKEAGVRCSNENTALEGIYLLGYASHAVQDVASHRGRTNPEHAYNALFETNPDKVAGVDELAVEMSAAALKAALDGTAKNCIVPLRTLESGVLVFPQKLTRFGFSWDGTPSSLAVYQLSARSFAPHKKDPAARVRWFGPVDDWPKAMTCAADPGCKALLDRLDSALR